MASRMAGHPRMGTQGLIFGYRFASRLLDIIYQVPADLVESTDAESICWGWTIQKNIRIEFLLVKFHIIFGNHDQNHQKPDLFFARKSSESRLSLRYGISEGMTVLQAAPFTNRQVVVSLFLNFITESKFFFSWLKWIGCSFYSWILQAAFFVSGSHVHRKPQAGLQGLERWGKCPPKLNHLYIDFIHFYCTFFFPG